MFGADQLRRQFHMAPDKFVFVYCCVLLLCSCAAQANNETDIVDTLFKRTQDLQVKKSTIFIPLIEMKKDKGIYGSNVKLNFHGPPEASTVRKLLNIFDNNMFATAWVTVCLLEASAYGGAPSPTDEQLEMAIAAINQHKDKNRAYPHSLMAFWPQVYNETVRTYDSTPSNLIDVYKMLEEFQVEIEEVLNLLGLKEVETMFKFVMKMKSTFLAAFRIPPDFDDTFVNLGLGSLLSEQKLSFPSAHAQWSGENTNLTSILDALKHYAYRPFSSEGRVNTVDSRTYFYLRHFLEKATSDSVDVALVPTWIQDIDEARYMYARGSVMPFNVNNVDVTVSANAIYGITSGVMSGLLPVDILDDPDVQKIYLNTTSMIAFEIQTNMTSRRDLAMTYYPSLFEFYWFVARSLFVLESKLQTGPLPHKALIQVHDDLSNVLRKDMTEHILKSGTSEGGQMYFDDFLGDGDVTKDNKTLKEAEDRIFTTTMATNALIQTWSIFDPNEKKMFWIRQTSSKVKDVVRKSVSWLEKNTLSGKYEPWNAFFSGSGKSHESMPFWYPGNRLEYLNGTKITDYQHFPNATFIYGFQGSMPDSAYIKSCNQPHFGEKTPMDFHGFNVGTGYFPFWSSDAYTYASTLLAISQFRNMHEL